MSPAKNPTDAIRVKHLRIEVITGDPANDPHGQGFSAVIGYVEKADPAVFGQLSKVRANRDEVTIRCAALEIDGTVGKIQDGKNSCVCIAVSEVRFAAPGRRKQV
jgi:hypothetical protein